MNGWVFSNWYAVCTYDEMSAAVLSRTVLVLYHITLRTHNTRDDVVISLSREQQFKTYEFFRNTQS